MQKECLDLLYMFCKIKSESNSVTKIKKKEFFCSSQWSTSKEA